MDATLITFALLVAAGAIVIFVARFWSMPVGPPESWGQFGDYLGGIVNPAVGIVTAFLVARTLAATRLEAADTRAEMKEQTTQLKEQLATSRSELAAAEVRRQLEAILEEWRRRVAPAKYSGPLGAGPAGTVVDGKNRALEEIFDSDKCESQIGDTRNSTSVQYYLPYWIEHFSIPAQLVAEMAIACERYDTLVGSRAYTDFYRRRVAGALSTLTAAGFVAPETSEVLRIDPLRWGPQFIKPEPVS